MNKIICKTVLEHQDAFVPHLFTRNQVGVLNKYLQQTPLTPTEKAYLYSTIKRKIEALSLLREEFYVQGEGMIPKRVEEAKEILKGLHKGRAFISGSFLFKEEYQDIDIFIVGRKREQYQQGKKQFIFLTWSDLAKPIFFPSVSYCVSTFSLAEVKPDLRRTNFEELLLSYEVSINEIIENDDQKTLRYILNYYYINVQKRVLNSSVLDKELTLLISQPYQQKIAKVNALMKELLIASFSGRYLYTKMSDFIRTVRKLKEEYSTNNLDIYLSLAEGVKNESRISQAEA